MSATHERKPSEHQCGLSSIVMKVKKSNHVVTFICIILLQMNPASFYGRKFLRICALPTDPEDSELQYPGSKGWHACFGTVRINRVQACNMSSDADMKKQGRGTMEIKTATADVELRAMKWFDKQRSCAA